MIDERLWADKADLAEAYLTLARELLGRAA